MRVRHVRYVLVPSGSQDAGGCSAVTTSASTSTATNASSSPSSYANIHVVDRRWFAKVGSSTTNHNHVDNSATTSRSFFHWWGSCTDASWYDEWWLWSSLPLCARHQHWLWFESWCCTACNIIFSIFSQWIHEPLEHVSCASFLVGSGYFNKNTGRFQMTGQPNGNAWHGWAAANAWHGNARYGNAWYGARLAADFGGRNRGRIRGGEGVWGAWQYRTVPKNWVMNFFCLRGAKEGSDQNGMELAMMNVSIQRLRSHDIWGQGKKQPVNATSEACKAENHGCRAG